MAQARLDLSRLEAGDPINFVKRQAGIAAQIHALAGEYRTHVMLGGKLEGGLVRLWNIDETRIADGINAKRAEESLRDVGRVGKKWAYLVTDAAFAQDPVALETGGSPSPGFQPSPAAQSMTVSTSGNCIVSIR